jgi:hypothetical protein
VRLARGTVEARKRQVTEPLLTFDGFRIGDILEELTVYGATSVKMLPENLRSSLLVEAEGYSYRPEPETVGSGESVVHQQMGTFEDFPAKSRFWVLRDALQQTLARSLAEVAPYPFESPLNLNAMALQKNDQGSLGITPHRDRLIYVNLILIIVLGGRGRFCVCADRSGRESREINAPPGNAIFLRAPGFSAAPERPFHYMTDTKESRYVLGLRQPKP